MKKFKRNLIIALAFLIVIAMIWFFYFSGRTASRVLGTVAAQVLKIENMQKDGYISISHDKDGSSTVKNVTFIATDGYIYTQEFKDLSPLEGIIRWVPYGEGSSFIQTRAISRWTGIPVNLELPKGCKKVSEVGVNYSNEGERTKNVTCYMDSGKIISKEYREGLINRAFEGYIEIRPVD